MQCPPGINPRTVRNFPIQSTGAEILHVACILAERRGIEIVAPVHDALMAEADLDRADEVSAALDRVMRDASAIVLRGYELPTDVQIVRPAQRYYDDRGVEMWNTVEPTAQASWKRSVWLRKWMISGSMAPDGTANAPAYRNATIRRSPSLDAAGTPRHIGCPMDGSSGVPGGARQERAGRRPLPLSVAHYPAQPDGQGLVTCAC